MNTFVVLSNLTILLQIWALALYFFKTTTMGVLAVVGLCWSSI